ncbi:hypothetical protein M413DRAFT_25159 [Hebeloma cylindrosporum]|uniref:Protein kinase domain-containing protein n=1 Tax=Hebeloma cylindrosporum TaxID=76867 RepID=A0A0C3CKT7_HEBCY|nr:hypothetical protein M413DRAFT_25159 [Hebeloma cylindrosporum h7]
MTVPSSPQRGARLASPIPSSASSRSTTQTPDPPPESSSKTFQRFRSSLEQSIRTATRSKKVPPPGVDEFATLTAKGKEKEKTEDKMGMLRRVTFRKRESSPPPPPKEKTGRVAGFTSFITPSMRQATMSSPALHLSSQPFPSPKSRPAVPASSSSTTDPIVSPSRTRSRKTSLQPSPTPVGGPSRRRSTKSYTPGLPPSPSTPTLSHPSQETPTRSTRTRDRDLPSSPPDTPTPRGGAFLNRTPSKKNSPLPRTPSPVNTRTTRGVTTRGLTSASTSHLPSSSPSPPPTPTPRRPSIDHNLPPSTPRRSDSKSRRASVDHPPPSPGLNGTRRASVDSHSRPLTSRPRGESPSPSPSGGIRPRAITPVQRSYAQNRHFNISSGSLVLGSTSPTLKAPASKDDDRTRDLIRTATSMICREVSCTKPPLHMSRTEQGIKDWDEVELRMRALVRLERVWGRSAHASPGTSGSGEERERKIFVDALRDGLMNKLRSSNIVRPDTREDGFVRTSNITKFLASCASYGMVDEDLFLRDDLIEGTREGAGRVARTVTKLVAFVEEYEAEGTVKRVERERAEEKTRERAERRESRERTVTPETQRVVGGGWSGGEKVWLRGQGLGKSGDGTGTYSSRGSASTPNLLALQPPTSPVRKRWSPPEDMTPLRSYSPEESPKSGTVQDAASEDDDQEHLQDAEVKPVPVPHILKPPPRSPLRKPSIDKAGLFSWARAAASPMTSSAEIARSSVADSTRASIGDASLRDDMSDYRQNLNHNHPNVRQSVLSLQTETTATSGTPSIVFDAGRSSSGGNYSYGGANNTFGTVRTMTTDLTSEAPSISRTEGSAMAEEIKKKRSNDFGLFTGAERGIGNGSPAKGMMMYNGLRERKMSEAPILDLSRVAEETDESVSSKGHSRPQQEERASSKPTPIHLRKGKWPDDFIDAFHARDSPPSASSTPPMPISPRHQQPSPFNDDESNNSSRQSTPISISPPRKLAIVGAHRRPTHRPRHSIDSTPTNGLLPKENVLLLRREASPDSASASSSASRVMIRRHSLKHGGLGMSGAGRGGVVPISGRSVSHGFEDSRRSSPDSEGTGTSGTTAAAGAGAVGTATTKVPFPRSVSGEGGTPSPRSSSAIGGADNNISNLDSRPRLLRGRFQSDIEGSSSAAARRRARPSSYDELGASRTRFESMVNLGATSGTTSASDLMMPPRDSIDGSAVRARLVVREDGKPPTHFQLGNCIGRGQFGSVYRALNLNTGQMVAVKRIRLEGLKEEEVTTLMREVDLVKSLSHPSIVKYEGMARDEDTLSIVLEYVENGSLGQTLKAFGKLNERLVASYVVKILEGLHYLHTSDVVHCDLKAANILTTKNGNVKLSDFGVSLNLRAMEREIKDVAGTPNWMAPEVIELKGASTKSDIWSLGCTVIELLTGKPPYAEIANSMSVMFRIVEDDMPPIPEGSSDLLRDFLEQCFDKDPTRRPNAEMLCEHPWLKKNWVALKELRPQDSIPFLRRVSTDLHKSDAVRYLSQLEIPESPISASPKRDDVGKITPIGRRTSTSSVRPVENEFSPREHSFVKTTFSKPMVCRVCLLNVKKSAVLCSQCSLVSHAKCAINAPPTCDLRAQLLLYAQYAEKGNPASAYSNPAEIISDMGQNVAMSDVPFVDHNTPRNSIDSPQSPQSQTNNNHVIEHPPTAFKFMAAFRRSRTNLSPEPVAPSSAASNATSRDGGDEGVPPARRRPQVLTKRSDSRPLSVTSDSTGLSSLRSAATAAESFSSRQNTSGKRSQASNGDNKQRPMSDGVALERGRSGKANMMSSGISEAATDMDDPPSTDIPGGMPNDAKKKKHRSKSSNSSCRIQ